MTEVTGNVFIQEPVEIVAKVMDRSRAEQLAKALPFNESNSLRDQRKNNQKRMSRKQADRQSELALLDKHLWDEQEENSYPKMARNFQGHVRLDDLLSQANASEKRQILKKIGVVAVDGDKLHFKPRNPPNRNEGQTLKATPEQPLWARN